MYWNINNVKIVSIAIIVSALNRLLVRIAFEMFGDVLIVPGVRIAWALVKNC
jgi:hypothetical protein